METCIRGFSFMPEKIETSNLQYVDSEALEHTWKLSRRERAKQQEQKIWEEFVNEQDVVTKICKDDPYQFIDQLSEEKLKELLEIELQKMRIEKEEEVVEVQELVVLTEDKQENEVSDNHHVVFVEEKQREDGEMFRIFDDQKEDDVSGPEDELLNDSLSPPCTVRERQSPVSRQLSPDKLSSSKSSENVTNMIESSIYCAKVRDLRMKIQAELEEIITALEQQDIVNLDPADVPKMMKRSVEFASRFNRIHMYQLHRQIQDIKRVTSQALPFARRTHFQAQMVRAVSLHHNALHSVQVFSKSFPQTRCIRDSGAMLRALTQLLRDACDACRELTVPDGLTAAKGLFYDALPNVCDKLNTVLEEYTTKLSDYLNSTENTSASCSRRSTRRSRRLKRSLATWSKSGTKSFGDTEGQLSMYSLETMRANSNAKSSVSKDNQSGGTSKNRANMSARTKASTEKSVHVSKRKRSPRFRRPLMRDPQAGQGRPKRKTGKDLDVPTLVETVATCTSSHISREASPGPSLTIKDLIQKKSKENSPRSPRKEPKRLRKEAKSPRRAEKSPKRYSKSPTKEIKNDLLPEVEKIEQIMAKSPRKDGSFKEITPRKETPKVEIRKEPVKDKILTPRVEKAEREREKEMSPRREERRSEREKKTMVAAGCEVTTLLRQLCGGDGVGHRNERVLGAKNAQLVCVNGGSPRQPSTPQLLRILEETIQKKTPRPLYPPSNKDMEKYRMLLNTPEPVAEQLHQYRTKFVQHMLTSCMYANSAVGKPWEVIEYQSNL
ncbi:uncharacterized protein LOC123696102 isoform X2 [Colias croceus]|uniref:uncharacterized protein LOC123696102 isoform X2 n=1 Tax=Colias crocea TaxID=72248 RepID=UPI001E27C974|nr:uncharacterized protein LOC123696102 isoform X2 [Colias croceus]